MIKFKKLSIKNFLSYGNAPTVIQLDTVGTTLIVGEDLDNTASGTGGNGCGKTSWVNGLIFALYGKPISNISLDNLVNNVNKKDMRVEVEFEVNKQIILVRRARKEKGAGNYAKVFVRDIGEDLDENRHDKTPDSVSNINGFIEDYLGIPYELFIRIVTFTATHTPFLDLPIRQQSDMMEELFSLTQLSIKAEALKREIKDTKQTLEIKTKHIEQLETEHERHNILVDKANNRVVSWAEEQETTINDTQALLDERVVVPVKEQEKLHKLLDSTVKHLDTAKEKLHTIETDSHAPNAEYKDLQREFKYLTDEKQKVEKLNKDFIANSNTTIGNIKEEISVLNAVNVDQQLALLEDLETMVVELENITQSSTNNTTEIDTLTQLKSKHESELEHLNNAKCPYCLQDYDGAKKKMDKYVKDIKKINTQILDLNKDLTGYNKESSTLMKKIDKINDNVQYDSNELLTIVRDLEYKEAKLEELAAATNPYVEQLANFADFNDQEMLADIKAIEKTIKQFNNKQEKQEKIVLELKTTMAEVESKITISDISALYKIKSEIEQYTLKLKDLHKEVNPFIEPLDELKAVNIEPIDMGVINKLDSLITHQNYLVKLLTKKDSFIRKTLLNKNLAFLNQRLQNYLSSLGLPHRVEFTQEMTAKITQFGRELDFGNLSSGQKARVNLALAFSFRDVLQQSHDSINVCMLDEVLDVGLDMVGVQNAARMLKHKAREEDLALYIISHRDEVSNIFDNKLIVQMKSGFSSVKVD